MRAAFVIVLLALSIVALVFDLLLARTMIERFHMNDFGKFYYSARAFLDGRDMYAPNPATDLQFAEAPGLQYLNMNPPHFHLLIIPFAAVSADAAVGTWMALSIFALIASLLLIAHELGIRWTPLRVAVTALATLACSATQAFFLTGQLTMVMLTVVTMCWIDARRGRWGRAAVWLGVCLSIEPFFLIFVPYLIATRRFRPALIAIGTAAAGFAIGLLVFGPGAYGAWYQALTESNDWSWANMNASPHGLFRRSFQPNPSGSAWVVAPWLVKFWVIPAGLIGVVTLAACVLRNSSVDSAFALLLIGAQLVSPLGWIYYVPLAAGPAAAVVAGRRRDGAARPNNEFLSLTLATVALLGFIWPLTLLGLGQPHGSATFLVASIYFWSTLAAWMWLLIA